MGYLLEHMEKLAKETERSLGDKALLAGGALTGIGTAGAGMNIAENLALGSDAGVRSVTDAAGISNAGDKGLKKVVKGLGDKFMRGAAYKQALTNAAIDQGRFAAQLSQVVGASNSQALGTGMRTTAGHIWNGLPKKVKLLTALGLPITAAAGYGGYKATDAMLGG